VPLRDYQEQARAKNESLLANGARSICTVAPTGAGKGEIAKSLVLPDRTVWLCHRDDLLNQTVERVAGACPVMSIPTLARRGVPSGFERVLIDECHHVASDQWQTVIRGFGDVAKLGFTATPERSDGKPLGDTFQHLVIAASYSQLLAAGHLAPCRVFAPTKDIDNGLAQDPVAAYLRYTPGKRGFCFGSSIKQGERFRDAFIAAGVPAELITGKTPSAIRKDMLKRLESGTTRVLVNCTTLTEGIDAPYAEVCILARRCAHVGLYLQIVGRILRTFPGKEYGILVDLVGAVKRHGLPTMDREYSLEGAAIRKAHDVPSLRQCFKCGAVMTSEHRTCITCGVEFIPGVHKPPKILNVALEEVYAGSETPLDAKQAELMRMLNKGDRLTEASKKFERLFGHRPDWSRVPNELLAREVRSMLHMGRNRATAYAIVKSITGRYPR
jgi:DNA repair protein RadD